ncbi:MAG: ABC transporter permease [Chloroflexota bacterium]|nr:ABC transporter permease [Chloroflexota bacterium]
MGVSTWRLVLRRIRTDGLMVAAAWLVILGSLTVLAAGVMYSDSVARSGLLRTLVDADPLAANVQVSAAMRLDSVPSVEADVERLLSQALGPADPITVRHARSESYALPDQPTDEVTELTAFAFAEGLAERTALISGAWPESGAEPLQAAISEPAAALLGLASGDETTLISRIDRDRELTVQISGTFAPIDPVDAYWWRDALLLSGTEAGGSFTTFGPLMVSREDLLERTVVNRAALTWRVFPDFTAISPESAGAIRNAVRALPDRLESAAGGDAAIGVDTELGAILTAAAASLLVNQTGVLLLNIQLTVLAGYAILLLAGLLAEQRRAETALFRSRGASPVQLARMSILEAAVMVAPAVIIAPFLALAVLGLASASGPLGSIGLVLRPRVTDALWALVAGAGSAALVALVLPVIASVGPLAGVRRSVGRQPGRALPQRLGLDIALVVLAGLGLWQLNQYGSPITRSLRGSLGADPLLVAAPALGLLAGAVLALRVVPLLAKVLEHAVARRAGLVSSLGARQMSRRPLRYTRSALLLMVASAIGFFAGSYSGTWEQSQRDQVDYGVGADVRATAALPFSDPMWAVGSAYRAIPGVERAMPAMRQDIDLGRTGGGGTLLAVEPEVAPSVVTFRSDMADEPLTGMMSRLRADTPASVSTDGPAVEAVALPDEPARVALDVDILLTPQASGGRPLREIPGSWRGATMGVVLRDEAGLIQRFDAAPVAFGEGLRVVVDLSHEFEDGSSITSFGPLHVVAVEFLLRLPEGIAAAGSIQLLDIQSSASPEGEGWATVPLDALAGGQWVRSLPLEGPQAIQASGSLPVGVTIGPDQPLEGPDEVRFGLRSPGLSAAPSPLPAIANDRFLEVTASRVGDELAVGRRFATPRAIRIVSRVAGFPTIMPDEPAVIVGLPALMLEEYIATASTPGFDEWWLSVEADRSDGVAAAAEAEPLAAAGVMVAARDIERRLADPIALGVIGALSLGAAAAALFGAIGFVVSAAVAARERLSEFALLRALGLSTRQLSTWLSLENAFLLLVSLVIGVGLGAVLAWVVLPTVTLTAQATTVVPPVRVILPWHVIATLALLALVSLAVSAFAASRLLRRVGLGTLLRMGAE